MKFKTPTQNIREPLAKEEIAALFSAYTTLKQQAALHIFYSCGLRRSEGEALSTGDVHFKDQLLYVREGKGAKRRVIPITDKVTEDLQRYYEEERYGVSSNTISDGNAFILNSIDNRMSGDGYNKLLKVLLHKSGLSLLFAISCSNSAENSKEKISLMKQEKSFFITDSKNNKDFLDRHLIEFTALIGKYNIEEFSGKWEMIFADDKKTWTPGIVIKNQRVYFISYIWRIFLDSKVTNPCTEVFESVRGIIRINILGNHSPDK